MCVVDGWRQHDRDSLVCLGCELRMAEQLSALARGVPLLEVVAGVEPTLRGGLNIDAIDLTAPGTVRIVDHYTATDSFGMATGPIADQVGHNAVARQLAMWVRVWTGREVWSADAASIADLLRRELARACRDEPAESIALYAKHLRLLYAAVRAALGRNLEPVHFGAPCPHCGRMSLRRIVGGDWIECGPCQALWDEEEYFEVAAAAMRWQMHPNQPLSIQAAAVVAGVSPGVIRLWLHRGKIWYDIGPWGAPGILRIVLDWELAIMEDAERKRVKRREERERKRAERLRRLELRAA